jgi:hypothetical protein
MKIRLGLISWATGMVMLAAVSACSGSDADPPSSSQSSSSSLNESPTSASPTSPSEAASTAAASVVRMYFRVVDDLRQRPGRPLSTLRAVSTSGELSAQQRLIGSERERGLRQIGDTRIADLQVQAINLANADPQAGKAPTVQVDVCWSVVDVDVVDARGESVVSPSRPDSGWIRFTVANYHWSSNPDNGWRVASSQDLRKKPCAAS